MPNPPPTVVSAADRDAVKTWVDQNPLRSWRYAHQPRRLSILEAAELVGVGMSMIQMYERGVHKPGPSKTERLAGLLGTDWSDCWDAWLAARPAR